jgi:ribosomal protein S18 acetylase RimI-like enzyme
MDTGEGSESFLNVLDGNDAAKKLYENLGFRPVI